MSNSILYFRTDLELEKEYNIANKYFKVVQQRTELEEGFVVIPRYSALPFYKELEKDVHNMGCRLINDFRSFNWIANFEYYGVLKSKTFKTYFSLNELPDIPVIVKGKTNSRKHQWNTHFFANNKKEAIEIFCELKQDSLIGNQDIIFREYVPLKTFEELINGLKVANEFRFFFFKDIELCHGYYWSQAKDVNKKCSDDGIRFAHEIANIVQDYNSFFVIDIAEKADGGWVMVELNSGEMSGLSMCDPEELYLNLKRNTEF